MASNPTAVNLAQRIHPAYTKVMGMTINWKLVMNRCSRELMSPETKFNIFPTFASLIAKLLNSVSF